MNTYIEFKHINHKHAIHVPSEYVHVYPEGLFVRRYPNKSKHQKISILTKNLIRAIPSKEVTDLFPNEQSKVLNLEIDGCKIHIESNKRVLQLLQGGV